MLEQRATLRSVSKSAVPKAFRVIRPPLDEKVVEGAAGTPSTRGTGDDTKASVYRKLAVTDFAATMVTVQVVPETASQPFQPTKAERKSGVTVRVTTVP